MKDRVNTVNELANASLMFYMEPDPDPELVKEHLTDEARAALKEYAANIETIEWDREALKVMMKGVLKQNKLKMPQVAMPLRLFLTGQLHTPSNRCSRLSFWKRNGFIAFEGPVSSILRCRFAGIRPFF